MKRTQEQTGIIESGNSVSLLTEYADLTAIVEPDGDILVSTSEDVRPTLTLDQLTSFYGAVKALHAEQTNNEKDNQ